MREFTPFRRRRASGRPTSRRGLPLLCALLLISGAAIGAGPKPQHFTMPKAPAFHPQKAPAYHPPKPPPMPKMPAQHHQAAAPHVAHAPHATMVGPHHPHHPAGWYHHNGRYYHPYHHRHGSNNRVDPHFQAMIKHLETVKADLDAIPKGGTVDPARKTKLEHDLMALIEGPKRVQESQAKQLATDLTDALSRRTHPEVNTTQLTLALHVLMSPGVALPSELHEALTYGRNIMTSAGVTREDSETVLKDMRLAALGPDGNGLHHIR